MKTLVATAFLAAIIAAPALAQPAAPTTGVGPVCIHPFWTQQDTINHTHVLDPQHVLFYMRDGKVLLNTLKGPCPGLMFHGFSFVTPEDDICANSTHIQVIETHETCSLGPFTPYAPTSPGAGR
ncbi:MAG TPA: hypothetical protein VHY79_05640 [Rhizomicrobium sp.]|jgi:hypothetical protein|nr:hypothetical protein [Rhizomicrobium sp.]